MALGRVTYLDLTPEQRREGAAKARSKLKALLANPMLTADQRAALRIRVDELRLWEAGTLHTARQPVRHHVVKLDEVVPVKEEI